MRYQISGPLVHVGGFDQYPVRRGDLVRQSGDWHQSELNVNLLARFDDAAGKKIFEIEASLRLLAFFFSVTLRPFWFGQ